MPHYTVGFVLSPCKQYVLLLKKQRPPQHKNKLNGIGGKIESDETPLQCIGRECREETGLLIRHWYLIERGVADDGGDLFTYTAISPAGTPAVRGDAGQALWYQISALPPQVLLDVPRLVQFAVRQTKRQKT